jgi:pilus assembly protein CpaC
MRIFILVAAIYLSQQATVHSYQTQRPQVSDVPQLTVIASKSIIVNTAEPIERVAVTSTEIADALVISPQQVMINGKAPGVVSLVLWDRTGKSTSYDLVVEIDLSLLQRQLEEQFPTENISGARRRAL